MHNVSSSSVFAGDESGAGVGGKEKWKGLFCVLLSFSLALQERLSLMLLIYCADSVALVRCCNGRCRGAWQTVCDCVCAFERKQGSKKREFVHFKHVGGTFGRFEEDRFSVFSLSFCPLLTLSPLRGFVMLMWRDVADS